MSVYYQAPDGSVHALGDPYLSHHGVLGMKWGVRRYQPYPKGHSVSKINSSRKIQRSLNKNDANLAKNRAKRIKLEAKRTKAQNRVDNAKNSDGRSKKLKKLGDVSLKVAQQDSKIAENMKTANSLLAEAKKNGYTVDSKQVERTVNKGSIAAQTMLASGIIVATAGVGAPAVVRIKRETMTGTKYKVKKRKNN